MLCSESSFGKEGQAWVSGLFPCLPRALRTPPAPGPRASTHPTFLSYPWGCCHTPCSFRRWDPWGLLRRPETALSSPWGMACPFPAPGKEKGVPLGLLRNKV